MTKKKIRQFTVPMEISLRGRGLVEARDAEEATAKAEKGEFEFQTNAAEMFDWDVTGDPKEDN